MIDLDHIIEQLKKVSVVSESLLITERGRTIKKEIDSALTNLLILEGEIKEQQHLANKWVSQWTLDKVENRSLENIEKITDALELSGRNHICKPGDMGCACSGGCVNRWLLDNEFLMQKVVKYIKYRTEQMYLPKENILVIEDNGGYVVYHKDLFLIEDNKLYPRLPELMFRIKDGKIECASSILPEELRRYT